MGRGGVPKRRNGFSPPYSWSSLSAWIALLLTYIEFLLFVSPVLQFELAVALTVAFTLNVAIVVYYGGLTLGTDPMDVFLRQHLFQQEIERKERKNRRKQQQQQQNSNHSPHDVEEFNDDHEDEDDDYEDLNLKEGPFLTRIYHLFNPWKIQEAQKPPGTPPQLPNEPMKQCWICDIQVAEHSMHCKFCNKCVSNFDHHCMWLNTCIGKANYEYFFKTLISLLFLEVFHFGVQMGLVVDIIREGPTHRRAEEWFDSLAILTILLFFIAFSGISILLVAQLFWFHIGLRREQLTTYKYIVRDHQRKRDMMRRMEDLNNERIQATARARAKGQFLTVYRLRMGEYCRNSLDCPQCDPLQLPPPEPEVPPDTNAGFAMALGGGKTNGEQRDFNNGSVSGGGAQDEMSNTVVTPTHFNTEVINSLMAPPPPADPDYESDLNSIPPPPPPPEGVAIPPAYHQQNMMLGTDDSVREMEDDEEELLVDTSELRLSPTNATNPDETPPLSSQKTSSTVINQATMPPTEAAVEEDNKQVTVASSVLPEQTTTTTIATREASDDENQEVTLEEIKQPETFDEEAPFDELERK